jgi:hypothetical protein
MSFSKYRQIIDRERGSFSRWNVIPNVQTIASYSFITQTIELSEFGSEDYKKALSGIPALQKKATVLLAHELRHWLDHIGSLWGQQILCLGYNALNSRIRNKPEELWRIVQFRQALRDNRFESYYTTIESVDADSHQKTWKYQMSAGARFDHSGRSSEQHPILFTRFRWEDDTPACRVPMSVASLLETSAMHFELRTEQSFLALLSANERTSASAALQRKYLDMMYDPKLAEYSVAVHAVSNFVGPNNCPDAFELSSILAGIALNLTKEHFTRLRVPDSFLIWGERNNAFIANMDRGYAFLVLAKAAPRVPIQNIDEWIEQTLTEAGLPTLKTIKADAMCAIEALAEDLVDGPLSGIRDQHRNSGLKIFAEHGPIFRFEDIFKNLTNWTIPIPPIILGQDFSIAADGEIQEMDVSPISRHIETLSTAFDECVEFADACGI